MSNGHDNPALVAAAQHIGARPPAPTYVRREMWIAIDQDAYPGYQILIWKNFPQGWRADLRSGDEALIRDRLQHIVLEHNDWPDPLTGDPYPSATDPQFWSLIPDELAAFAIRAMSRQAATLPN